MAKIMQMVSGRAKNLRWQSDSRVDDFNHYSMSLSLKVILHSEVHVAKKPIKSLKDHIPPKITGCCGTRLKGQKNDKLSKAFQDI